jgi:hypothetical protein
MSVFATDMVRLSNVLKHEYEPSLSFCRDVVTMNDAAATLPVGTVLGKVTATGKYKVSLSAAVDGSQNPVAILVGDSQGNAKDVTLAATTDTAVQVLARGPVIVAGAALTLGTGITLAAATAALKPLGMLVETQL